MNVFAQLYVLHNLIQGRPGDYGLKRVSELAGYKFTYSVLLGLSYTVADESGALVITEAGRAFYERDARAARIRRAGTLR